MTANPEVVVITGASGGIGAALARAYADPERTLLLLGRDTRRLDAVAGECQTAGARTERLALDVADTQETARLLRELDQRYRIDLIFANAGISPDSTQISLTAAEQVLSTNVRGVLNCVHPLLEPMRLRGRGQIAVMGSLNARLAIAASPAYSMSKAAIETYGLALRSRLAGCGIRVSVISPGFVVSPMSERVEGLRPLLMDADQAAARIRRGLARNRARIAFPRRLDATASLIQLLPYDLGAWLLRPFEFRVGAP